MVTKTEDYQEKIREWEYCYCRTCDQIRYIDDLEATDNGIMCKVCGGSDLEAPAWIICPHEKVRAVKCARAGKGIVQETYLSDCKYRCHFRKA